MPTVDVALPALAELAEAPTWDGSRNELVWVDILAGLVHRFTPASGHDVAQQVGQHIGAAKPTVSGELVAVLRDGIALVAQDSSLTWLATWSRAGYRGNDAGIDSRGRLWAGTMPYDETLGGGALYLLPPAGTLVRRLDDVGVSNGIAWAPDESLLYFADSPTRRVDAFDFDAATGELGARRAIIEVAPGDGFPDGITVDRDGAIWVALYGGGSVRRYDPAGTIIDIIELPTRLVTACSFGGADLTDLYITTASCGLADEADSLAGALFVVPDAGVGTPAHVYGV